MINNKPALVTHHYSFIYDVCGHVSDSAAYNIITCLRSIYICDVCTCVYHVINVNGDCYQSATSQHDSSGWLLHKQVKGILCWQDMSAAITYIDRKFIKIVGIGKWILILDTTKSSTGFINYIDYYYYRMYNYIYWLFEEDLLLSGDVIDWNRILIIITWS